MTPSSLILQISIRFVPNCFVSKFSRFVLSLGRFVTKPLVDSYPSQYTFICNTSGVSAWKDVSCWVRQISSVKQVRYWQNSDVHTYDFLKKKTKLFPSARYILKWYFWKNKPLLIPVTFSTITVGVRVIFFFRYKRQEVRLFLSIPFFL